MSEVNTHSKRQFRTFAAVGYGLWKPIMLLTILDKMNQGDSFIDFNAGYDQNLRNRVGGEKLLDYCGKDRYEGIFASVIPVSREELNQERSTYSHRF